MKTLQILVRAIALTLVVGAAPAVLAHGDDKPKYGGVVAEVKDVNYELVAKADTVALCVEDHGKKVDTKGATAKLTLLTDGQKTEVMLMPAGDGKLEANGSFSSKAGTKAIAVVTLAGKPPASVRFEIK